MKTAVIYCRVSSDEQVRGTSLTTQEQACREWCARSGAEVVRVYRDEGETAKTARRPQFLAAIEWCRKHGPDLFLVYRYDRFARNRTDHAICASQLATAGVRLYSVSEPTEDDPAGRLLETMLSGIAQFDNEVRADRSRRGMAAIVQRGGWCWRAPFGYALARDGNLPVLNPDQQHADTVRRLFADLAAGAQKPASILRRASESTGQPLRLLYDLVRNPVYVGVIRSELTGGVDVQAAFSGLIDRDTWEAAQHRLNGVPHGHHSRVSVTYPLRGVVRCATCGGPLTGATSKGRGGRLYPYYFCRRGHARSSADALHGQFESMLAADANTLRPWLKQIAAATREEITAMQATADGQREVRERAVRDLEARRDRLVDLYLGGGVEPGEYRRLRDGIDADLAQARTSAAECSIAQTDVEQAISVCLALLADPVKLWRNLGPADQTEFASIVYGDGMQLGNKLAFKSGASPCIAGVLRQNAVRNSALAPPTRALVETCRHLTSLIQRAARLLAA